MRRTVLISCLLAAVIGLSVPVAGQIRIGTVAGTLTDPVGARLPGARVTLSNALTGYNEARTTDDRGEFTFNNVPFDRYWLQAAGSGFQMTSQRADVRSNIPTILEIDFSAGADLFRDERVSVAAQFDIQNVADRRFAYNFGNPFEGTHFDYPRLLSGRIKLTFR